jgi:hypothetical protein
MVWNFRGRPVESLLGLVTVLAGGAVFYGTTWMRRKSSVKPPEDPSGSVDDDRG